MIKNILYIIILVFLGHLGVAQTALFNSGSIRIHETGAIGFHTNLINNSAFDQNLGLAGFYGTTDLIVSGAFVPIFYDSEIINEDGVFLNTGITVTNNFNFISGNILTARNTNAVTINFDNNAFNTGESDESFVDGYASISNQQNFIFPVGDFGHLRPLRLNSSAPNDFASCAYFYEDPNNPNLFNTSFNTALREADIASISNLEFWILQGAVPSRITVNWDAFSNISSLTETVNSITLVGWNTALNRWVVIGNTAFGGDLTEGFITSATFIPDEYGAITFGSLNDSINILTLDNFYLTPNGDGLNDVLVIEELEQSPNNSIRIFDRFGLKVFESVNNSDVFNGISNVDNNVIQRNEGLPVGVYFYLVSLDDLGLEFQGFLYLNR